MKYLQYYNRWMRTGRIDSDNGMCYSPVRSEALELFKPTYEDLPNLEVVHGFWAYDGEPISTGSPDDRATLFTPLRQNIVLFLAAMNNEL